MRSEKFDWKSSWDPQLKKKKEKKNKNIKIWSMPMHWFEHMNLSTIDTDNNHRTTNFLKI